MHISGAKNAAASILPGALLVDGVCRITNVPDIRDVRLTFDILETMGAKVKREDRSTYEFDCRELCGHAVPRELGIQMRASHFFLGALLGRVGDAASPLPGGCDLGERPIDQHLKGFEAMGADVAISDGYICVTMPEQTTLRGTDIVAEPYPGFPTAMQPQIGAVMCCAEGKSSIRESVWSDRFRYLQELKRMGVSCEVDGQQSYITGSSELTGAAMTACDLRAGAAMIIAALAAKGTSSIDNIRLVERGCQERLGNSFLVKSRDVLEHASLREV